MSTVIRNQLLMSSLKSFDAAIWFWWLFGTHDQAKNVNWPIHVFNHGNCPSFWYVSFKIMNAWYKYMLNMTWYKCMLNLMTGSSPHFYHKYIWVDEEKHKLVHTINRSLDRESNPWPLAYGNTASIKLAPYARGRTSTSHSPQSPWLIKPGCGYKKSSCG
jgi:hypothetical protein